MSVKEEIILDEEEGPSGSDVAVRDASTTATSLLARNGGEVVQPDQRGVGSERPRRSLKRPEKLVDSLAEPGTTLSKKQKTDVTKEEVDMKVPVALSG